MNANDILKLVKEQIEINIEVDREELDELYNCKLEENRKNEIDYLRGSIVSLNWVLLLIERMEK